MHEAVSGLPPSIPEASRPPPRRPISPRWASIPSERGDPEGRRIPPPAPGPSRRSRSSRSRRAATLAPQAESTRVEQPREFESHSGAGNMERRRNSILGPSRFGRVPVSHRPKIPGHTRPSSSVLDFLRRSQVRSMGNRSPQRQCVLVDQVPEISTWNLEAVGGSATASARRHSVSRLRAVSVEPLPSQRRLAVPARLTSQSCGSFYPHDETVRRKAPLARFDEPRVTISIKIVKIKFMESSRKKRSVHFPLLIFSNRDDRNPAQSSETAPFKCLAKPPPGQTAAVYV